MNHPYSEEYIKINGIDEYLVTYLKPDSDVVILFLHGGPGEADSVFTPLRMPDILPANICYYDQRGAGKTQLRNKSDPEEIVIDKLVADLVLTIEHLKSKFKTEKIVLAGHSFGTVLAHYFLREHSGMVVGFISIGQVVSLVRGEDLNFKELSQKVLSGGLEKDKTTIEELKKINYPFTADEESFMGGLLKLRKIFWTYRPTYSTLPSKYRLLFLSPLCRVRDLKWIGDVKLQMANNRNLLRLLPQFNLDTTKNNSYKLPVYFISGEDDYITPTSMVKEYFATVSAPKTEMFTIPYAAHSPQADNPKEFWNVIGAILFNLFNEPEGAVQVDRALTTE